MTILVLIYNTYKCIINSTQITSKTSYFIGTTSTFRVIYITVYSKNIQDILWEALPIVRISPMNYKYSKVE